ncbi:MAG: HAD-IIB family hydrolase [Planctomycetia bacterium]|nr:HAD-IIB family hydrolase [Planctomycetia bacterium]
MSASPPTRDFSGAVAPPRVRLLALDVDGTLTNSRHEVADSTSGAIARVVAAGVRVMLATGRRYRDTLPVAGRLNVDTPLVTASGALVKRPSDHGTLHRAAFAPGLLEGVLAEVVAAGHEPILYTDSFAEGYDFHCRSLADARRGGGGLADYLDRNRDLARVTLDLDVAPPAAAFAGFAMGERDPMRELQRRLEEAFPGRLSLHTIRSPRYLHWMCEIAPAGVTKWTGVMAVAREWGIAACEICAVGDDVNDLPMIRGAGLGVAMGNARPEVLADADVVVGTHDGTGMSDVAELVLASLSQPTPIGPPGPPAA